MPVSKIYIKIKGRWEGSSGGRGTYVYLWLIHVDYGRNQHNIVNQLSSNIEGKKKTFLKSHWVFGSFEDELLILLVWHLAINTYFPLPLFMVSRLALLYGG